MNSSDQNKRNSNKCSFGRHCHIVKRPDFDGYGFNLHSEKIKPGQYIGKVDANSPAEAAGLHEGDQIIEVNGVNIGNETHKQVVQRIKAISNEVHLLLIDPTPEVVNTNSNPDDINEKETSNCKSITNLQISNAPETNEPINQSKLNTNLSVDITDSLASTKNGHQIKSNGQTTVSTTTSSPKNTTLSSAENVEVLNQNANILQMNTNNKNAGLNLNLTAAEMRAKLSAKKKFDPKNETVDLKKKFEIIQKL